ncbi:protein croquemort-like [Centruroides sculpturatus]|uniref:protein croquemort-like n=1 Tax=Centruroides sculpturatus TaxID=218467 RepID=UPI000C6E3B77|nr:protein croquemort-like [Centruroides sculpturatus]
MGGFLKEKDFSKTTANNNVTERNNHPGPNTRLILSEESEMYEQWKEPSLPIYLEIYLFNITNPEDVEANISKPIVEEVGPFSFREKRTKENITWNDNGTVSYRLVKTWYFQPDRTNGSLDDHIITVNVPMIVSINSILIIKCFRYKSP